jgi:hypothetical protein
LHCDTTSHAHTGKHVTHNSRPHQTAGKDILDFYADPSARALYKLHVWGLLSRPNPLTGLAPRDDPTIFSFNLINEPRCPGVFGWFGWVGWVGWCVAWWRDAWREPRRWCTCVDLRLNMRPGGAPPLRPTDMPGLACAIALIRTCTPTPTPTYQQTHRLLHAHAAGGAPGLAA